MNYHLPHGRRTEVHQPCDTVRCDTSSGLEAGQVGAALATSCAIGESLGHRGDRRASRVPWLLTCEWAVVAGFDEASNMAFERTAGSHALAAAAHRGR